MHILHISDILAYIQFSLAYFTVIELNQKKKLKKIKNCLLGATVLLVKIVSLEHCNAFVNPEESFQEGLFYMQITTNLLIHLRTFHE